MTSPRQTIFAAFLLAAAFSSSAGGAEPPAAFREGEFFISPSHVTSASRNGLFFNVKKIEVRIHFRADLKTSQWCCAYVSLRTDADPQLALMLVFATDGKGLHRRTIGYRIKTEKGKVADLALWTVDRGTKNATIEATMGEDAAKIFVTQLGKAAPVSHEQSDGRVFLVTARGTTLIKQLSELPDSLTHDDCMLLAKKIALDSQPSPQ